MVTQRRVDRQGVNVANKLSIAIVPPVYGGIRLSNIIIAGDIVNVGSMGRVMPVYTDKPRLNSTTKVFDRWEITENIQFQLDSYIPEIDRMAGLTNIASTVARTPGTHVRASRNTLDTENPINPLIMIYPALQNLSPGQVGEGIAENGMVILAEGEWYPSDIAYTRGELITYDIEFQPDRKYIRTIAGESTLGSLPDPRVLLDTPQNADRFHDFDQDVHWIDGINQTEERERAMALLAS